MSFSFTSYDELPISSCSLRERSIEASLVARDFHDVNEKLLHESIDELRFWMLWMELKFVTRTLYPYSNSVGDTPVDF